MQTSSPRSSLQWLTRLLLNRARPIEHILFWFAVLFFYTLYFGSRQDGYGQNFIFIGLLLPITAATTYVLLYWLIPRYLLQRRYALFCLYLVYTLIFSVYLELLLVLLLYINVSDYQAMFVKPGLVDIMDVLISMYLVIFLASAINLLKRWFSIQTSNAALEKSQIETELKLKSAELQLLKSQIHPHFLFNTLNNLYGLALEKSDLVPDVVLRMSEQLDYMLYRTTDKRVPLTDEVHHIKNYIELESLRYADDQLKVSLDLCNGIEGHTIEPLLLLPFVENSFKHGVSSTRSPGWITIRLEILEHSHLVFFVENSKKETTEDPVAHSGIGLKNVQRRLELLYPERHELDLQQTPSTYSVKLTLQLDELA